MNEHHIPNMACRRFEEINFDDVLNEKRRFLLLDLDNTLMTQRGEFIEPVVSEKLRKLRESGKVEDVCLISNVIVPGPRVARLHRQARKLNIDHIVPCFFFNRKPKAGPFKDALRLLGAQADECVMVGDQIFSDILGGNKVGMYTIWLEAMSPDHWTTLVVGKRLREKKVVEEIKRRGLHWDG